MQSGFTERADHCSFCHTSRLHGHAPCAVYSFWPAFISMRLPTIFNLWNILHKCARRPKPTYVRLILEELETRLVPYATAGYAWVHPELVTISFMPDGTLLGYNGSGQAITSTLFHDFSKLGSAATWEKQIEKAAQVWAQQTNINFAVVADDGAPAGSGNYEQGDPGMGDIRIDGYSQGPGGTNPLASAYMPPPANNYSIAGDITFNTSQPFNLGNTYDLFTVASHEMGHALGLLHSWDSSATMYPAYSGTATGLNSDDIAGIRTIYSHGSARSTDSFDAAASNGTFAAASTLPVNTSTNTALVTADISTTADVDMYNFTAPSGSASSMTVTVQSQGLSLLSPKLYVYNSNQQQIGFSSGAGQYGTTLSVSANITPGQQYYVKVQAAETTAFGTGVYALIVNTGTGASPTVSPPNTQTAASTSRQSYGGQIEGGHSDGSLMHVQAVLDDHRPVSDLPNGFLGNLAEMPMGDSFYAQGDPDALSATKVSAPAVIPASLLDSAIFVPLRTNTLNTDVANLLGRFESTIPPRISDQVGQLDGALRPIRTDVNSPTSQADRSRSWLSNGESTSDHDTANLLDSVESAADDLDRTGG
jgi:hypothetical protein